MEKDYLPGGGDSSNRKWSAGLGWLLFIICIEGKPNKRTNAPSHEMILKVGLSNPSKSYHTGVKVLG